MSMNTIKQRRHLYEYTFMKWPIDNRLTELQRTVVEVNLRIMNFGSKPTDETFNKFCEALSDFETMLEVSEMTFPGLRSQMDKIKKAKLRLLKKQSLAIKHEERAAQIKEDALNLAKIIEKQETENSKEKGLKKLFRR